MDIRINDIELKLETEEGLFSPHHADEGTLAMLSETGEIRGNVLDLGCGYGIVGIYLKLRDPQINVMFTDIDSRAVMATERNIMINGLSGCEVRKSDGFSEIPQETRFDCILSNPPYHTDFSVAKNFIEGSYRHLVTGGTLYMVTKRLDWYRNKLTSVFGGVRVRERDGYYIFIAEKRIRKKTESRKNTGLSKKLERKYGKR